MGLIAVVALPLAGCRGEGGSATKADPPAQVAPPGDAAAAPADAAPAPAEGATERIGPDLELAPPPPPGDIVVPELMLEE